MLIHFGPVNDGHVKLVARHDFVSQCPTKKVITQTKNQKISQNERPYVPHRISKELKTKIPYFIDLPRKINLNVSTIRLFLY